MTRDLKESEKIGCFELWFKETVKGASPIPTDDVQALSSTAAAALTGIAKNIKIDQAMATLVIQAMQGSLRPRMVSAFSAAVGAAEVSELGIALAINVEISAVRALLTEVNANKCQAEQWL